MEINGIAHVFVTVSDFARSRAFYQKLLPYLGLVPVMDGEGFYYCVGGRTAFGLRPAAPGHRGERFVQDRVGLHHLCFRARAREDVDLLLREARRMGRARSCTPPRKAPGRQATTRCSSRTPTGSDSSSTSSPAGACWRSSRRPEARALREDARW